MVVFDWCGVVCHVVLCCVVSSGVVLCGVWCGVCPSKTSLRVYRHHAHMLIETHVRCGARMHGDVLNGHTGEERRGSSSGSAFS